MPVGVLAVFAIVIQINVYFTRVGGAQMSFEFRLENGVKDPIEKEINIMSFPFQNPFLRAGDNKPPIDPEIFLKT